jgi:hypothetical protein
MSRIKTPAEHLQIALFLVKWVAATGEEQTMQSKQPFIPPFAPVSCAEVTFSAWGEDCHCAATWIGIVVADTFRFYATLVDIPEGQTLPPCGDFSVRLPSINLPAGMMMSHGLPADVKSRPASAPAIHIECRAGTLRLEHGRLILDGDIVAISAGENIPWLRPLSCTPGSLHPAQPVVH